MGITYQFSYAVRHNDAKNMIPLPPCYLHHLQIFGKTDSFLNKFVNIYRIKKELFRSLKDLSNSYLIVLLISFFPLLLWITAENRTKLKK